MEEHDLIWKRTPKGLVKRTPWGWQAACKCGWEQPLPAGVKSWAIRSYDAHKERKDL